MAGENENIDVDSLEGMSQEELEALEDSVVASEVSGEESGEPATPVDKTGEETPSPTDQDEPEKKGDGGSVDQDDEDIQNSKTE